MSCSPAEPGAHLHWAPHFIGLAAGCFLVPPLQRQQSLLQPLMIKQQGEEQSRKQQVTCGSGVSIHSDSEGKIPRAEEGASGDEAEKQMIYLLTWCQSCGPLIASPFLFLSILKSDTATNQVKLASCFRTRPKTWGEPQQQRDWAAGRRHESSETLICPRRRTWF